MTIIKKVNKNLSDFFIRCNKEKNECFHGFILYKSVIILINSNLKYIISESFQQKLKFVDITFLSISSNLCIKEEKKLCQIDIIMRLFLSNLFDFNISFGSSNPHIEQLNWDTLYLQYSATIFLLQ